MYPGTEVFFKSTDAPLEGKTVLLVGGEGPLGLALQCLIERSGVIVVKNNWSPKSLQKQVCEPIFRISKLFHKG